MALWDTVRRALGLQRQLEIHPPSPAVLHARARARLQSLPPGHGITLQLLPRQGAAPECTLRITEGELKTSPDPSFSGLAVACPSTVAARLQNQTLDYVGGRWLTSTPLTVHARETPNPHSRIYATDRHLAVGSCTYLPTQSEVPAIAGRLFEANLASAVFIRDHTLTVERVAGTPWSTIDPMVVRTIEQHLLGCGGLLTQRNEAKFSDPLHQAVDEVIRQEVLPAIHRDGGDLELVEIVDDIAYVRMAGACRTCAAAESTLHQLVSKTLCAAFPGEIIAVRKVS